MKTRNWLCGFFVIAAAFLISCGAAIGMESTTGSEVSPDVVATIGDYSITRQELKTRLSQEIRPQRDEVAAPRPVPTAESVLLKMLGEKAMTMEGRAAGYLNEETTVDWINQVRRRELIPLLLVAHVDKVLPVPDEQVDELLEAHPELTRERAIRQIQTPQVEPVLQTFFNDLLAKYHVRKVSENFVKAAEAHRRLLNEPASPRGTNVSWITTVQVQTELTEEEKNLPLIVYDGGKITLYDWFKAVCEMAPPSRPKDLSTPAGVEKLLNSALQPVILTVEAVAQGFDKDPDFVAQIRQVEDRAALSGAQNSVNEKVATPTDEEVKAFFDAHAERFGTPASLKMDRYWCPDLESAEAVREMLASGASVQDVNEAHPELQITEGATAYASSEGMFWEKLWDAEPNSIVGPLRGFHADGIRWRVVRILEKTPIQVRPFDENTENNALYALQTIRQREQMAAYQAELLEKYPYEIYADRIADIDPLEVTSTPLADAASRQR